MQLQLGLFHLENISFYVIDSPRLEVIQEYLWLSVHDPVISWHHCEIAQWSQFCYSCCLHAIVTKSCLSTSIERPNSKSVTIPSCYQKYQGVSTKTKATQLPPHHSWDCAIDLLPNVMSPKKSGNPGNGGIHRGHSQFRIHSSIHFPSGGRILLCGKERWRTSALHCLP